LKKATIDDIVAVPIHWIWKMRFTSYEDEERR